MRFSTCEFSNYTAYLSIEGRSPRNSQANHLSCCIFKQFASCPFVPKSLQSCQTTNSPSLDSPSLNNRVICNVETVDFCYDTFTFKTSSKTRTEIGLLDSGAGCNCINKARALKLSQQTGQVEFSQFDEHFEVTLGSGDKSQSNQM